MKIELYSFYELKFMNDETKDKETNQDAKLPLAQQLLEAGVHFGHRVSRWNPKMKPYIYGVRNTIYIIDLEKTTVKLKEATDFVSGVASNGGVILFVGTKPTVRKIIKEAAESLVMPFVTSRWLGGTFTNFRTIAKRLEYFRSLEDKISKGEMQQYTKKERLIFERELDDLKKKFEGIKNLFKLPQAVFIADMKKEKLAVREARKAGIPIVAICDVDVDPTLADWPIPGNDDAASAVKIILDSITEAIKQAKKTENKKESEVEEEKKEAKE